MRVALLCLAFFAVTAEARADPDKPDAAELSRDWQARQPMHIRFARSTVPLSARNLQQLAAGEVVRQRQRRASADRAIGAAWTRVDRDAIWIAILDDAHDTLIKGLTEIQLPGTRPEHKFLYQHIDFPWPFTDRQWVIEIQNNPELWDATAGGSWERTWRLASTQLAKQSDPGAIWTPVNEGGWMLVDAAGGTLLIYHVRSVVGGVIPDDIVTRWALTTLDDMLNHVMARASTIADHYGPEHTPVYRPDGSVIPPLSD